MTRQVRKSYLPPDGHPNRGNKIERELNEALALCFKDAVGERALKYLRSITIEYVQGPGYDPQVLAHLEGARWLVAVIERRLNDARENKPHVD